MRNAALNVGLLVGRVPIGVYFLVAGVGKLRGGVGAFVEGASKMVPSWVPEFFGSGFLHVLPFVEVVAGVMVVVGVLTRVAGVLMALLLVSFIVAVTGVRDEHLPFQPNVVYLGLAVLLGCLGGGGISVDGMLWRRKAVRSKTEF